MKSMYRAAIMMAAFVFLLPLSALSEIRAGSVEVNPFVGYNFFQDSQNLKNAPIYGGRLGYNFTKYFGVEVAGEFIRTNVDDTAKMDNTEGQFGYPMDREDFYSYHVDAILHLIPDGIFNPFIVAGFGGAHYSPSISNGGDMSAFNVGLGAKYWLTDNVALRFDVQDYMVTEIFQETYHNIGVTAGIVFAFGGKAKPAPEPVVNPEPKPEPKVEEKVVILAPEPKEPIVVTKVEKILQEKVTIALDVKFDFAKAVVKKEYHNNVKKVADFMKEYPGTAAVIEGHTDNVDSFHNPENNKRLSYARANSVRQYLIDNFGIDASRITAVGYGLTRPIASNNTAEGRQKNRRVQAVIEAIKTVKTEKTVTTEKTE